MNDDEFIEFVKREVDVLFNLVEALVKEAHTKGYAVAAGIPIIARLFKGLPITPLTGEDSEWESIGGDLYQNVRCFRVFKDGNGAYDAYAKIFSDDGGITWDFSNDSISSREHIEFPYYPADEPEQIYLLNCSKDAAIDISNQPETIAKIRAIKEAWFDSKIEIEEEGESNG